MKKTFSYSLILLAGCFALLPACHSSTADDKANTVQASSSVSMVLVSQVQNETVQSNISVAGVANPNQEVKVYAMCNGYVQSWKHDIGDTVKKDEILAELANPDLMQQQAKAQAMLDGDKAIYDRLENVYKKTPELTPLQDVDEAKAKFEMAEAQLNAVNSQISYLTVRAPFTSVVTKRFVDNGAVVQDGLSKSDADPLFIVQDISIIRVAVDVPEVNSSTIKKGTPVKVTFPDLPNTEYDAKVSRISYGLSQDTKTMQIQIDLSNKDAKIHPGMFANVVFNISSRPDIICIPNQSIAVYEEQPFVYRVVPVDSTGHNDWTQGVKCRIQKVKVQLGINNSNTTEVQYSDLKTGDRVVISGKDFCTDGATVIAREGKQIQNVTSR